MANPVALFGEVTPEFADKVIELRKKVKNWDTMRVRDIFTQFLTSP